MNGEAIPQLVPTVVDVDKEFWDGLKQNKLLLQKCLDCNRVQFFPRPVCLNCFGTNLGWEESKGTGTIYSFTLVRTTFIPAYMKQINDTGMPVIFTIIDLDEGVRMMSQIVGCKPDEVEIGERVKVTFKEIEGTKFKLPLFQLVK